MAFNRDLLNTNEELVLDLRPHWAQLIPSGAALAGSVVLALLGIVAWGPDGSLGSGVSILLGLLVLACLVWFGWTYLQWTNTNFVLTTDRIITRQGILSKEGIEIPLERVNTVFFRQRFLERLVGAGDLSIESASQTGSTDLSNIRKPSIVQKEIYVQMEANENRKFDRFHTRPGDAGTDPTQPQGGGHTIPEQIEKLAELHQRGVLSDAEYQQKKADLLDRM